MANIIMGSISLPLLIIFIGFYKTKKKFSSPDVAPGTRQARVGAIHTHYLCHKVLVYHITPENI